MAEVSPDVLRAAAAGKPRAQRQLLTAYAPQIAAAANAINRSHPMDIRDDLVAVGQSAALLEALPSYDATCGPFGAWVSVVARRAMRKATRHMFPANRLGGSGQAPLIAEPGHRRNGEELNADVEHQLPDPWELADALARAEEAGLGWREVQVIWAGRHGEAQAVTAEWLGVSKGRVSQLLRGGLHKLARFYAQGHEVGDGDAFWLDMERARLLWTKATSCQDIGEFVQWVDRIPADFRFVAGALFPPPTRRQPNGEGVVPSNTPPATESAS